MDPLTKAVRESFSEGKEGNAACLKTRCASEVGKCLSNSGGVCKGSVFRPEARQICRPVAKGASEDAESFCQSHCLARVQGVRNSSIVVSNAVLGEKEAVLSQNQTAKLQQCVKECKVQQGYDSPEYERCMASNLAILAVKCAQEKCKERVEQCLRSQCNIAT